MSKLKLKKAKQAEAEARLQMVLARAKRTERAYDHGKSKRKDSDFLLKYIVKPLRKGQGIRPADGYRSRSYNLERQLVGLIDHLFVRYPVPLFLYRSILSHAGVSIVFGQTVPQNQRVPDHEFRTWFFSVARGDSFAKKAKDVLTKREAHLFLNAPITNSIPENIFWAKCAAAGLPKDGCDYLVRKFGKEDLRQIGDRLPDVIRFYATAWAEMRRGERDEITDFVSDAARTKEFSFKGRTLGSMRKLCDDWHRAVYEVVLTEYRSWSPIFEPWEKRQDKVCVRAFELSNNRALYDEGKKQRHCVSGYVPRCIEGSSRIIAMRWFAVASKTDPGCEMERLTIEVFPRMRLVAQIRGKLNRKPTEEEMMWVRQWARDHALDISPYA